MHIRIAGLLAVAAALCSACGPSPGSAEWCRGVLEGKVQATPQQIEENDQKCGDALMRD
jgi:hypothetical protein